MSSSIAFVVLAHTDPPRVRRLLATLAGADLFLHCDQRATPTAVNAMLPAGQGGITLVDPVAPRLFSWSLVEAELRGLRAVLESTTAEHIVVMSGACYPLVSLRDLEDELSRWRGRSMFELNPIPYRHWNARHSPDGGGWRFTQRFATYKDNMITVGGNPVPLWKRSVPNGLELYGSSHWKVFARRHAQAILRILNENPEQLRYWRHVWTPEESCIASLLKSTAFNNDLAESVCSYPAWFMKWVPPTHHPQWLTSHDFDSLAAARVQASNSGDSANDASVSSGKLFARKIGSGESGLLDRIDRELRGSEPYVPAACS